MRLWYTWRVNPSPPFSNMRNRKEKKKKELSKRDKIRHTRLKMKK